jgi:hypothetical protein
MTKPFVTEDLKTWTCGKCRMSFHVGRHRGSHGGERHKCPDCKQIFYSGQADSKKNSVAYVYVDKHPWCDQ